MILKRNKYKVKNDEDLLNLYKSSMDKQIIGELYTRYGHLVYGLCLKLLQNKNEAEDKTMMIFESLYNKVLKHDISNFKSWLYSVTKNECFMQLRRKNDKTIEYNSTQQSIIVDDEYQFIRELQLEELENALLHLKTEQYEAIQLFYLKELSYKEISEILGWDLKKVKSQIQNAKRNLKIILEENHVAKYTT